MALHHVSFNAPLLEALTTCDCWAVDKNLVERLAIRTLGSSQGPLLRTGTMRAIVARKKFGAAAACLPQEFLRLRVQCAEIRSTEMHDVNLFAIAFFHLRFENIHPLTDGNGRVGRLLLAEQLYRAYSGKTVIETLALLHAKEVSYRAVFASADAIDQYSRMIAILASYLGILPTIPSQLPFALTPVYPEKNTVAPLRARN